VTKLSCEECQDTREVRGKGCRGCCEHEFDPDSGMMCLNCEADGYEHLSDWIYECERDRGVK
jgi:hypothetical protein